MSDILHIKDTYYFEVPKFLYAPKREQPSDFPDWWIRHDADFQKWEAEQLYQPLVQVFGETGGLPAREELVHQYEHWKHDDHKNFGKPFERFLEEDQDWFRSKMVVGAQVADGGESSDEQLEEQQANTEAWREKWNEARATADTSIETYLKNHSWSQEKLDGYNAVLKGKILIPQVFGGELRNLYEKESGFCISKFMIVEVVVGLLLIAAFNWLGKRVVTGDRPRGRLWNFLEAFLLFIRNEIARPAIGHGADAYVPYLWTVFMFILGCNLFGLVPWAGAPTGSFGVTCALALMTFGVGFVGGTKQMGVAGYWKNLIPDLGLPIYMAIPVILILFPIEVLGLAIKHLVLAIRLLANMVAGHLVLLAIMGMAFSVVGAMNPNWWIAASVSLFGATVFSCLELFVAFLQAYVFTFLSALFIGAAVHHH